MIRYTDSMYDYEQARADAAERADRAWEEQCERELQRRLDDMPLDPPGYAARVDYLEQQGLSRSDAQGVADAEFSEWGTVCAAKLLIG